MPCATDGLNDEPRKLSGCSIAFADVQAMRAALFPFQALA
jgi:hypothetical protein